MQADVDTTVRKRQTGGHYSTSIRAGDFVFVAGQVPRDAERLVVGVTIEEQTAATIENLRAVLEEAGATPLPSGQSDGPFGQSE